MFSASPSVAEPNRRSGSREHPPGVPPLRWRWIVPSSGVPNLKPAGVAQVVSRAMAGEGNVNRENTRIRGRIA